MHARPTVVAGRVCGLSVNDRGMVVKLLTRGGTRLLLRVGARRVDFAAQLQVVRYALVANEDDEIRAANGFETGQAKELWAVLAQPLPTGSPAAVDPVTVKAVALGLGAGRLDPFDTSPSGFGPGTDPRVPSIGTPTV